MNVPRRTSARLVRDTIIRVFYEETKKAENWNLGMYDEDPITKKRSSKPRKPLDYKFVQNLVSIIKVMNEIVDREAAVLNKVVSAHDAANEEEAVEDAAELLEALQKPRDASKLTPEKSLKAS